MPLLHSWWLDGLLEQLQTNLLWNKSKPNLPKQQTSLSPTFIFISAKSPVSNVEFEIDRHTFGLIFVVFLHKGSEANHQEARVNETQIMTPLNQQQQQFVWK